MKKRFLHSFLVIGFLSLITNVEASLSGAYSVNPSGTASSTNYLNIKSVVSDLASGTRSDGGTANGSGVSGAVTITLKDTIYAEQISISAITGASSTNTITFQSAGKDSTTCMLKYPSSSAATNDYVLQLSGAQYFRFSQIGFQRTGTAANATVIQLNTVSTNNIFSGCFIKGKSIASTTTIGFSTGLGSCVYSSSNDSANTFRGNYLLNGYNGFYFSTSTSNNQIIYNRIDSSGSSAFYGIGQNSLVFEHNLINLQPFKGTGPYVNYGIRLETSSSFSISKNKIYGHANATVLRPIVLFSNNSSGGKAGLISNNFIWISNGTSSSTGIGLANNTNLNVVHNNVLQTASLKGNSCLYIYPPSQGAGSANIILNNNFTNNGGGYAIDIPGSPSNISGIDTCDFNNLTSSGTYLAQEGTTGYTSLSAWRTGVSFDANSVSTTPGYVSSSDLHTSAIGINGKATPLSFITTDIDGDTRSTSIPDIGADEFSSAPDDAGISSIDSPNFYCSGAQNVSVKFANFGSNTLTSLSLHWSLNGVTQTGYAWTGTLASGLSSPSIKLGTISTSSNTKYTIVAWVSVPNTSTTSPTSNDSLSKVVENGMSGKFTIGSSSGVDYSTFNEAVKDLTLRGVCGPVTIEIEDGTYNEQISIPSIYGTTFSNSVTWISKSKDSSKVTLSYATSTAGGNNNATLQLNSADYQHFKHIGVKKTGLLTYGTVVDILNTANSNSFEGCLFTGTKISSAIALNNNIVSSTLSGDDSNKFIGNHFKYGNRAIAMSGDASDFEDGTMILNNVFDSNMAGMVFIDIAKGTIISGNNSIKLGYANTVAEGISISNSEGYFEISKNNIQLQNGATYGITLFSNTASGLNPRIQNNFITINKSISTVGAGIKVDGSDNVLVLHNSVNIQITNTTASCFGFYNSSSGVIVKNNSLVNKGGYALFFDTSTPDSCDYNNLYNGVTSRLGSNGGTSYTNLSAWKSGSGFDANSIQLSPQYTSITDLHLLSTATNMVGKGIAAWGIRDDYDGNIRSSKPSIGADERILANDAAALSIDSLPATVCEGTALRILATIGNNGTDSLKSLRFGWKLNGVVQDTVSYAKLILSGNSLANYYFRTTSFTKAGTYILKAYTYLPNGKTDDNIANDTISKTLTVVAKPASIIQGKDSICLGATAYFRSANKATSYSWKGSPSGKITGSTTNDSIGISFAKAGIYSLQLKVSNGSCDDSITKSFVVVDAPKISFSGKAISCEGVPSTLKVSNTAGLKGVKYSFKTSTNYNITSSGLDSAVYNYKIIGSINIIVNAKSTQGCSNDDTFTVVVLPKPLPTISTKSPINVCQGNMYDTIKSSNTALNKFKWDYVGATVSGSDTLNNLIYTYPKAGNYRISLKITNKGGCSDTISKAVNVRTIPSSTFSLTNTSKRSYTYTAKDLTQKSYNWNFGDGVPTTSTKSSDTFSYKTNGTYKISLTVGDGVCSSRTDSIIVVNVVGIESNQLQDISIALYPNPIKENSTLIINGLQMEKSISVSCIGTDGKMIHHLYDGKSMISNSLPIGIMMKELPLGMYFLRISMGTEIKTLKIIKE